jgi:alkaline phosphatase D
MQRRHFISLAAAGLVGCAAPTEQLPVPAADDALRRIAFGSCIDQTKPQPIWDTVLADRPDLYIFGGDNVYASEQPWSAVKLAQAYAQLDEVPGLVRLRETVPHMAIWDDHDYGLNDGGAEFGHKNGSKAAFLRFWQVPPSDPRHAREGLYSSAMFGPEGRRVQVILLDTRWFRSALKPSDDRGKPGKERYLPDADPAKTMLGDAQWRWLEEQLRQPAELRLLVSSIQVVAEGHGWERWGISPSNATPVPIDRGHPSAGVVFLSGDRHVGALYREPTGTPYPFYELTSSGITHTWRDAAEAGPNRLGELFTQLHYGVVDIDWARADCRALKDIRGASSAANSFNSANSRPSDEPTSFKVLGIQQIAIGGPTRRGCASSGSRCSAWKSPARSTAPARTWTRTSARSAPGLQGRGRPDATDGPEKKPAVHQTPLNHVGSGSTTCPRRWNGWARRACVSRRAESGAARRASTSVSSTPRATNRARSAARVC